MISMLAMAAMVSCTNEIEGPDQPKVNENEPVEIKFGSSISGIETKAAILDVNLAQNEKIGIFAVEHKSESTGAWKASDNYLQNIIGTIGVSGVIDITGNPLYPAKNLLDFYAYYPQTATVVCADATSPKINVKVEATNTTQIDYMWATPIPNIAKTTTAQQLVFNHALSLLEIKVIKDASLTQELVLSNISISVDTSTATMDISTGTLAAVDPAVPATCTATVSETLKTTDNDANILGNFVLLPGSKLSDLILTIGADTYTIASPSASLVAAQKTTFTVTLSTKGVSLSSSVTPWSGDNTGSGEI